jgi:hypothetical protein
MLTEISQFVDFMFGENNGGERESVIWYLEAWLSRW